MKRDGKILLFLYLVVDDVISLAPSCPVYEPLLYFRERMSSSVLAVCSDDDEVDDGGEMTLISSQWKALAATGTIDLLKNYEAKKATATSIRDASSRSAYGPSMSTPSSVSDSSGPSPSKKCPPRVLSSSSCLFASPADRAVAVLVDESAEHRTGPHRPRSSCVLDLWTGTEELVKTQPKASGEMRQSILSNSPQNGHRLEFEDESPLRIRRLEEPAATGVSAVVSEACRRSEQMRRRSSLLAFVDGGCESTEEGITTRTSSLVDLSRSLAREAEAPEAASSSKAAHPSPSSSQRNAPPSAEWRHFKFFDPSPPTNRLALLQEAESSFTAFSDPSSLRRASVEVPSTTMLVYLSDSSCDDTSQDVAASTSPCGEEVVVADSAVTFCQFGVARMDDLERTVTSLLSSQ